jgi:hypothetical protein
VRLTLWLVIVAILSSAAVLTAYMKLKSTRVAGPRRLHVVLIGASIARGWRLEQWPDRVAAPGFTAEALAAWQFDKSEAVQETLMRPALKFRPTRTYLKSLLAPPPPTPGIVILKECSSYFPAPLDRYRQSIREWVGQLQARKVPVMLATVVPVSRTRAAAYPGKLESLLEYNRWLRDYAREQQLPIVDLAAAMSQEHDGRYLEDRYDVGDGTHLNAAAYAVLDQTLRAALCENAPAGACSAKQEGWVSR